MPEGNVSLLHATGNTPKGTTVVTREEIPEENSVAWREEATRKGKPGLSPSAIRH